MADYYPLISRAVAGLEKNSGENRRALYERARAALLAQLRGVTPALNESDITRERLALEESIRKVEAEAARQFVEPSRQQPAPAKVQPRAAEPRAPAFEYLGTLKVETGTRSVVENGPQGTRTIVQVVGGRFEGPRLKASVQTPAGDWITNRADGSYRLDVRLTLKTDDGSLLLVTYNGIGQTTNAGASLRIAPLFETGDARYTWLTRLQAVGVGERVGTAVTYDIYALK